MIIRVDLDGTLCERDAGIEDRGAEKYRSCKPLVENIAFINSLYDKGHKIVVWTSRGMSTFSGDVQAVIENLQELTLQQLKEWGLKYHSLEMGKPAYDIYFDDKSFSVEEAKEILNE